MYLNWNQKTITDFSDKNISSLYNEGYVFTRIDKGVMNQTRSLRVDLSKFELSSENRRVLKKTEQLLLTPYSLPFTDYHWQIGKMAKNFYDTKFGDKTFSANKIKELLTDEKKSNFNLLFKYICHCEERRPACRQAGEAIPCLMGDCHAPKGARNDSISGYAICRETNELLHYSYPFYSLLLIPYSSNIGLGMMIRAILWAKDQGKKHIYLGSASRPTDTYKLQFKGVEWWDEKNWSDDYEALKKIITKI